MINNYNKSNMIQKEILQQKKNRIKVFNNSKHFKIQKNLLEYIKDKVKIQLKSKRKQKII